ncbi:TPA_asm: RNA-directed RNA polymerase [ssRNA phage Gephyllon.1_21]|uniref:RNA-directed RNA polymerase n=2 Tax=Leviviricetes TaxID=2842243 RepID=A0A8S5L1E5_9VIRU|nr:RNA-directed RNA polymerase [ssRNA phage Gephyllon.1_21]QDH89990.1 MAG: RNA-dependent RNA polymerase [Leviviridae sp.]DAD51465.1 TPA_asm: RNA-directed RNA polymerase [ssRNA phage Gephyllon.1_21]
MKSQAELWRVLAYELASRCHTSAARDWLTVKSRVEHEGVSFLTITLPAFGKAIEESLDRGRICDDLLTSFRKDASGLPRFLGGFLRNMFDEHGVVRQNVDDILTESVFAVRQLCYLYAKLEIPCTPRVELETLESFVNADEETGAWDDNHPKEILADFSRISSILFADVFSDVDRKVYEGDLRPRHGPGATADRLRGNAKWDLAYWPSRLDRVFPYMEWAVSGLGGRDHTLYSSRADRVSFPDEADELPARMYFVPKTRKSPRVIMAEPTSLQYMQQAVARTLMDSLESSDIVAEGMIGFFDQSVNQHLARKGSIDRSLATLDMKEASDRVSLAQALALVPNFPWLREAMEATRSLRAQLVDGRVITLRKFAGMGSALCFPVEAMVFLTGVFMGIERKLIAEGSGRRLTRQDVKSFKGSVRVFGDDIIIPADCVEYVSDVFTRLGWVINTHKSFWTGLFRESCGGDYYAGADVTPIRAKQLLPRSRKDVAELASTVELRNRFYEAGLWSTAGWLDRRLEKILPHFPIVEPTSPALGRRSFLPYKAEKFDQRTFAPRVRAFYLSPRIPESLATGEGMLLKCLLSSSEDPRHLVRSGRPQVVDIKLGWKSPF